MLYKLVKDFKRKYPGTVCWRIRQHCKIVDRQLASDEKILYAFAAQKNPNVFDIVSTCVVAITNKRIVIGQKRLLFGYFFTSITPDLFNDIKAHMGLIWGRIIIDTVKEVVILSNISKKALIEIEKEISEHMIREKKKYLQKNR